MPVSEIERQMGIEVYSTSEAGIGGVIRRSVEDFVVEEALVDGSKATVEKTSVKPALGASSKRQLFLLCILVKRNWDTFVALKNIARELGVEASHIQIAGIKDAKAVTAQYISIKRATVEEVAGAYIRDVELRPVGYFHEQMCPFYLLGNTFRIKITGLELPADAIEEQSAKIIKELEAKGGIPNFYGHQRFGTKRAITHLVGKAIIQGDLEEAAMIFLAKPSSHEHPESRRVRAELAATRDFKRALQDFPIQLRFERLMLRHLVEHEDDFLGAFRRLPLKLRMLFVQAWQSYLFNRFLSERIKSGSFLSKVETGDFVVNVERSGLPMPRTGKIVKDVNVGDVNRLIDAGKLRFSLPIFGSRQKLSGGKMGELEKKILEEEGMASKVFNIPALPEINAKGELRTAICPIRSFSAGTVSTDSEEKLQLSLEFMLLRGSYATVLLRELMKPKDLIAAGF